MCATTGKVHKVAAFHLKSQCRGVSDIGTSLKRHLLMLSYEVTLGFMDCLLSPGIRAANQLLCDGAGKHCFGSGALQWPEGGEKPTELLCVYMSIHFLNHSSHFWHEFCRLYGIVQGFCCLLPVRKV